MGQLRHWMDCLQKIILIIGTATALMMMTLTVTDVVLRATISRSFYGTIEVTQFMLAVLIFSGLALVTRDRSHIVVSLFEPFMLRHMPRVYWLLFSFFNLVGVAVITYLMIDSGLNLLRLDQRSLVLGLPQGWLLITLGGLSLIAVVFGLEVFRVTPDADESESPHPHETDI